MIYIIGRSGNIGRSLIDYLSDLDLETHGIGRSDSVPEFTKDDTIINCACHGWEEHQRGEWNETVRSNVLLPMEIIKRRNGANLIHFASGFELIPAMMTNAYALTKRIASEMLQGNAHIIYLYTIFGGLYEPGFRFVGSLIKAAVKGVPYTCTTPFSTRDFVHIDRLMKLIGTLINTKDYQSIQFGTGTARTLAQVVGTLEGIAGRRLDVTMKYAGANYFEYCADEPYLVEDHFVQDLKKEYMTAMMRRDAANND